MKITLLKAFPAPYRQRMTAFAAGESPSAADQGISLSQLRAAMLWGRSVAAAAQEAASAGNISAWVARTPLMVGVTLKAVLGQGQ